MPNWSTMRLSEEVAMLDWIHSLFQELENKGVDLPMGDYQVVYSMLEDLRENL